MLCDECKINEATVHVTKVINGLKEEVHLCDKCAKSVGNLSLGPSFSVQDLIAGFFQQLGSDVRSGHQSQSEFITQAKCDLCGLTLQDFRQTGRLGCGRCYETFKVQLNPILRRLHGSTRHTGKVVPAKSRGTAHLRRKEEELRRELQKAISTEEYERAAVLRDQIRQLEKEIDGGEVS